MPLVSVDPVDRFSSSAENISHQRRPLWQIHPSWPAAPPLPSLWEKLHERVQSRFNCQTNRARLDGTELVMLHFPFFFRESITHSAGNIAGAVRPENVTWRTGTHENPHDGDEPWGKDNKCGVQNGNNKNKIIQEEEMNTAATRSYDVCSQNFTFKVHYHTRQSIQG